MQKKAIITITNSNYNEHTGPLFKKLHILTFTDMFNHQIKKFMYKFFCNDLPSGLTDIFQKKTKIYMDITPDIGMTHTQLLDELQYLVTHLFTKDPNLA